MRSTFILACLASSVCTVFAGPVADRVPITKRAGPVNPNSYIVKLKDGVSKSAHLKTLLSGSKVAYNYGPAFQGYAAQLDDQALDYVRKSKDVESIFQDVQVQCVPGPFSSRSTLEGQVAARGMGYESSPLVKRVNGTGVDIYQIDTGIYTAHTQFGGRAKWGYPNADGNGHGTALASIIVGSTYGIATRANITAIKGESIKINHGASITHMIDLAPQAFGDDGSANLSDIISGINWVITNSGPAATRKLPTPSTPGSTWSSLPETKTWMRRRSARPGWRLL
ncbi:peptidase inhibitor i9 domain-containing protein [Rhizoctonia solani AG-1 IA]|uniref:Peptidase inhibitor i9 domain-containing protein n=1 Tax=Thanatephorus cucumeris (strain AG1-IA) TaxID=983506 RepID=L8WL84_THACA|nr:peptidase inhibitor i9 domain-containing protein [Rhizoctonia solani AG-1 IA]